MGSGKPGIHVDQVNGSRPAPHSLAESCCSHTHVNRKVENWSKVKGESQATHASVGAQELGRVQHIGIFQTAFGKKRSLRLYDSGWEVTEFAFSQDSVTLGFYCLVFEK